MAAPELVAFCEQQHPRLVGLLGLYCGDRSIAEEMAQEALARACRDWNKVRAMASPEAWVYRVALNLVHSFFRRRAAELRMRRRLEDQRPISHYEDPDIALLDAVNHLPHRQRAAVLLRYYLDLPVSVVSQVLDSPEGTVKTLTHKGVTKLRQQERTEEAPDAI